MRTGAHALADAGLLRGRRATTHWLTAGQLAAEHPDVTVEADPIFVRSGRVWTGAGATAGLDLAHRLEHRARHGRLRTRATAYA